MEASTSLSEFDHAREAAFGEMLADPVQNAWLDSTAYWTVWLGQLYSTTEGVIDYDGSVGQVFDVRGKCDLPGYYCAPTWQLIRSCEADTALWVHAEKIFDEQIKASAWDPEWELTHTFDDPEDALALIGRMPYERSFFAEPPLVYDVACTD